MAPTSAGKRAGLILLLFAAALFIVDVVMLNRVLRKERDLAADEGASETVEAKTTTADEGASPPPGPDTTGPAVEITALQQRIDTLEGEAASLRATVKDRFADYETIKTEAANVHVALDETRATLDGVRSELEAVKKREADLLAERKTIADVVARQRNELTAAKTKITQLDSNLKAAREKGAGLQKSLDETNTTLEAAQKVLKQKDKQIGDLKARVAELEAQLGDGDGTGEESAQ